MTTLQLIRLVCITGPDFTTFRIHRNLSVDSCADPLQAIRIITDFAEMKENIKPACICSWHVWTNKTELNIKL